MSRIDGKSFICTEGRKHNGTPAHPHTSRYSRHLWHALESVGRHRRYKPALEIQRTTLRGAGACAHERRTGVVAAEGAAAKGHCPLYRRAHARSLVSTSAQQRSMLGTYQHTLQQVVVQMQRPVSRRKRELGKTNDKDVLTFTEVCMFVCMIV